MSRPAFAIPLTLAIAVAMLGGCVVGPTFRRPDPPSIDRYTSQPLQLETNAVEKDGTSQHVVLGEQLSRNWWHLFQSDALNNVVTSALAGNRTLVAAAATLAQAQELAAAQAGTLAPQVSLTGGIGRQKYGDEFLGTLAKPPPFTYFAVGPTVSYIFDYTGGIARSIEQQRALADYQRHQLDAAYLAVTGNAVMQSVQIASLRAQIATVEAILDEDRQNLKLVHMAFAAGAVSHLDIVSAENQLASDATLLPPLHQALSLSRHALAIILGRPPASATVPDFDLSQLVLPRQLPVSLPSELVRRRPDILAAEAQLHAATAAVGMADANFYPHISLTASTSQQSTQLAQLFDVGSNAWGWAGTLVAPIFDGGTLRAEKRATVDAMHASAANYEQTVLVAFSQVADSLEALDHGAEQVYAQTRAQDAARQNLDLTRKSYREGNVSVLQVLDAERLYQQARLGYVRAQAQRYMDTAQLFLAVGGEGTESKTGAFSR